MDIGGQLKKFPDGNEITYINGAKFSSRRIGDSIYLTNLIDNLSARWASTDSIWEFITPPYTQCINELAEKTGTSDLISTWTADNGGIINVYNPGMKDNGVIVRRIDNHVYVDVKYNIWRRDYNQVDGMALETILENGMAKWASNGKLYYNDKNIEQMGDYSGIEVNVSYTFAEEENAVLFNFHEDKVGSARAKTVYADEPGGEYNNEWKINKHRKVDLYNYEIGNSYNVEPLKSDSMILLVAHEFGHVLGLSDAYARPEFNLEQAPLGGYEVPDDDIMRDPRKPGSQARNGKVTPNDIEMMLLAFMRNEQQYYYTSTRLKIHQSEAIRSYTYFDAG